MAWRPPRWRRRSSARSGADRRSGRRYARRRRRRRWRPAGILQLHQSSLPVGGRSQVSGRPVSSCRRAGRSLIKYDGYRGDGGVGRARRRHLREPWRRAARHQDHRAGDPSRPGQPAARWRGRPAPAGQSSRRVTPRDGCDQLGHPGHDLRGDEPDAGSGHHGGVDQHRPAQPTPTTTPATSAPTVATAVAGAEQPSLIAGQRPPEELPAAPGRRTTRRCRAARPSTGSAHRNSGRACRKRSFPRLRLLPLASCGGRLASEDGLAGGGDLGTRPK